MLKIDTSYYVTARLWPALLTGIPLLLLLNTIALPLFKGNLPDEFRAIYQLFFSLGLSSALVYLLIHINRLISKELFQKRYFGDVEKPTTTRLLWGDTFYEQETKTKIRTKIDQKYRMTLLSEEQEKVEPVKAKKLVNDAVSQIKISLQDNKLLLQHNKEYGFFRNTIGGSLHASIISLVILIIGWLKSDGLLLAIGGGLLVIYVSLLICSRFVINRFAEYYAEILYKQFLSIE